MKVFVTNWDKNHKVRQLYYKVGQALLISRAASRYYKLEQAILQSGAGNLLQSWAIVITKCGKYYKVGKFYYKVGRELLQHGAGDLLQIRLIVIAKWGRYYKVGKLLQRRPVHLCDTRTNGDPCLLIRPCGLGLVLYNMM